MKGFLYLVSKHKIQFESRLFLKKKSFEYIYLPLKGFKKYFFFFFNILYPLLNLNHNQIYLLLNLILRKKNTIISYSYLSKRVQDLSKKFEFFKIVQIQTGALHQKLQEDLNLQYIDIFLSISEFQSKNALKHFAKKAFVVGSLSTENWIKNIKIACDINKFQYDICFICNTKFEKDIRYALNLSLSYILTNKNLSLFLALKSKTNIRQIANYCKDNFKVDIYNHSQIFFTKSFTKYSTIENALKAKVIVGVRSTVLYQLGSLGHVIYPIDISEKYGNMSGNLLNLNINLNPPKELFFEKIKEISTKNGRKKYIDDNFDVLEKLDETLRLKNLPSDNIIKSLEEI